jgi:hypothetical protein
MAFQLPAFFADGNPIYLDGQLHGLKPLKLDFAANRYVAAYAGLFGGTNNIHRDEGNDVDRSDYVGVYALYAYDLAPDFAENGIVNLSRMNRSIELEIRRDTAQTITVLRGVYEHDGNRQKSQRRIRLQQLMNIREIHRSIGSQRRSVPSNLSRSLQRRYFTRWTSSASLHHRSIERTWKTLCDQLRGYQRTRRIFRFVRAETTRHFGRP